MYENCLWMTYTNAETGSQTSTSFISFMSKCNMQYIHPKRNQIVENKSQQISNFTYFGSKLSRPEALLSPCPCGIIAPMERCPEHAPASHTRAEDIKWRHTWSDTNLAGPEQFPDSSLTLATGAAVTLGCSVTTCSGINAASHVDVSQHIHVNGALVAPALCLELSSWVIFIKEGKMVQNHNVMQTYQDSPCLQLTRVCKLIVMQIGDTDSAIIRKKNKHFPRFQIGKQMGYSFELSPRNEVWDFIFLYPSHHDLHYHIK